MVDKAIYEDKMHSAWVYATGRADMFRDIYIRDDTVSVPYATRHADEFVHHLQGLEPSEVRSNTCSMLYNRWSGKLTPKGQS